MYSLQTYICPSEPVQEKNCFVFAEEWKLCLSLMFGSVHQLTEIQSMRKTIEYIPIKMSAPHTTGALWDTRGIQS